MPRRRLVGIIGASVASPNGARTAFRVGELLAERGVTIVCGGLGGIMEAVCRGAVSAGGETVGILPGAEANSANPYVTLPIVTNMGHARNVVIAHTAEVLIAIEGELGTLSEVAIALKNGRRVITINSWDKIPGVETAVDAETAVRSAMKSLE
ncbi:MAG: TIGR00725 family protein [Desulfuromonas sp.]|nr:MAG: TIGR00725 family protein [Desulfuromonas sp.]